MATQKYQHVQQNVVSYSTTTPVHIHSTGSHPHNENNKNDITTTPKSSYFQRMINVVKQVFQPMASTVPSPSSPPPTETSPAPSNHNATADTTSTSTSVTTATTATATTWTTLDHPTKPMEIYSLPETNDQSNILNTNVATSTKLATTTTTSISNESPSPVQQPVVPEKIPHIQQIRLKRAPILLKGTTTEESGHSTNQDDTTTTTTTNIMLKHYYQQQQQQYRPENRLTTTVIQTTNGSITRTIAGSDKHPLPSTTMTTTTPTTPLVDPTATTTATTASLRRIRPQLLPNQSSLSSSENIQIVHTISDIVSSGAIMNEMRIQQKKNAMLEPVQLPSTFKSLPSPTTPTTTTTTATMVPTLSSSSSPITTTTTTLNTQLDSTVSSVTPLPLSNNVNNNNEKNRPTVSSPTKDRLSTTTHSTMINGHEHSTIAIHASKTPPPTPPPQLDGRTTPNPQPTAAAVVSSSSSSSTSTVQPKISSWKRQRDQKKQQRQGIIPSSTTTTTATSLPSSSANRSAQRNVMISQFQSRVMQQQHHHHHHQPRLMFQNDNDTNSLRVAQEVQPFSMQQQQQEQHSPYNTSTIPINVATMGSISGNSSSMAATSTNSSDDSKNSAIEMLRSRLVEQVLGNNRTNPMHRHPLPQTPQKQQHEQHQQQRAIPRNQKSVIHGEKISKTQTKSTVVLKKTLRYMQPEDVAQRLRSQIPSINHASVLTNNPIATRTLDGQSSTMFPNEIITEPLHSTSTTTATPTTSSITSPIIQQQAANRTSPPVQFRTTNESISGNDFVPPTNVTSTVVSPLPSTLSKDDTIDQLRARLSLPRLDSPMSPGAINHATTAATSITIPLPDQKPHMNDLPLEFPTNNVSNSLNDNVVAKTNVTVAESPLLPIMSSDDKLAQLRTRLSLPPLDPPVTITSHSATETMAISSPLVKDQTTASLSVPTMNIAASWNGSDANTVSVDDKLAQLRSRLSMPPRDSPASTAGTANETKSVSSPLVQEQMKGPISVPTTTLMSTSLNEFVSTTRVTTAEPPMQSTVSVDDKLGQLRSTPSLPDPASTIIGINNASSEATSVTSPPQQEQTNINKVSLVFPTMNVPASQNDFVVQTSATAAEPPVPSNTLVDDTIAQLRSRLSLPALDSTSAIGTDGATPEATNNMVALHNTVDPRYPFVVADTSGRNVNTESQESRMALGPSTLSVDDTIAQLRSRLSLPSATSPMATVGIDNVLTEPTKNIAPLHNTVDAKASILHRLRSQLPQERKESIVTTNPYSLMLNESTQPSSIPNDVEPMHHTTFQHDTTSNNVVMTSPLTNTSLDMAPEMIQMETKKETDVNRFITRRAAVIDDALPAVPHVDLENPISQLRSRLQEVQERRESHPLSTQGVDEDISSPKYVSILERMQSRLPRAVPLTIQREQALQLFTKERPSGAANGTYITPENLRRSDENENPLRPQFTAQEIQNIEPNALSSPIKSDKLSGPTLTPVNKDSFRDLSEISQSVNKANVASSNNISSIDTVDSSMAQLQDKLSLHQESSKSGMQSDTGATNNSALSIRDQLRRKLDSLRKQQPSKSASKPNTGTNGRDDAANRIAAQQLKMPSRILNDVGIDTLHYNPSQFPDNTANTRNTFSLERKHDMPKIETTPEIIAHVTHKQFPVSNPTQHIGKDEIIPEVAISIGEVGQVETSVQFQSRAVLADSNESDLRKVMSRLGHSIASLPEPVQVLPKVQQQSPPLETTPVNEVDDSIGRDAVQALRQRLGQDKEVQLELPRQEDFSSTTTTKNDVVLQKLRLKLGVDKLESDPIISSVHEQDNRIAEPAGPVIERLQPKIPLMETDAASTLQQPYPIKRVTMFDVNESNKGIFEAPKIAGQLKLSEAEQYATPVGATFTHVADAHEQSSPRELESQSQPDELGSMSQSVSNSESSSATTNELQMFTDAMDVMPTRLIHKKDESNSYASTFKQSLYPSAAISEQPKQHANPQAQLNKKQKQAPRKSKIESNRANSKVQPFKQFPLSGNVSPDASRNDMLDQIQLGLSHLIRNNPNRKPEAAVKSQTEPKALDALESLRAKFLGKKRPLVSADNVEKGVNSLFQMHQRPRSSPKTSEHLPNLPAPSEWMNPINSQFQSHREGSPQPIAQRSRSDALQSKDFLWNRVNPAPKVTTTNSSSEDRPLTEIIRNMQLRNSQLSRPDADANGNSLSRAALPSFESIHPPLVPKWRQPSSMASEFNPSWRKEEKRPHINYQRDRHQGPRPPSTAPKKPVFVDPKQQAITLPSYSVSVAEASQLFRVKTSRLIEILRSLGEIRPAGIGDGDDDTWMLSAEILELVAIEIGQAINESVVSTHVMTDDELMLMRRAAAESTPVATTETGVVEEPAYSSYPVRPPVVCIMGHVDHGKTTLMDALRRRAAKDTDTKKGKGKKKDKKKDKGKKGDKGSGDVAGTEAGGITQVISAFQVPLIENDNDNAFVTFLDTPGHAAFTAMRQSGSDAADIIVLVVAADDGVSEQTIEILDFYKSIVKGAGSGGISMVVAMNKIDKTGIDIEESTRRIQSQLLEHGILTEGMPSEDGATEYGPAVQLIPVSGKTGKGLDDLIDGLVLQSEMMDLRAPTDARAEGIVMDARVDKGMGIVADCIVRWGSIKKGDLVVTGPHKGKVRLLKDVNNGQLEEGLPSQPVRLIGFETLPKAGDPFVCVESEEVADDLVSRRKAALGITDAAPTGVGEAELQSAGRDMMVHTWKEALETKHNLKIDDPNAPSRIPVVVKADADGTLAAIRDSLLQVGAKSDCNVFIDLVKVGVGPLFGTEIQLAQECNATIICFNLKNDQAMMSVAAENGVKIIQSDVIYSLLDEAKLEFSKYLPQQPVEVFHGRAKVLATYVIGGIEDKVAGLKVVDGTIYRDKTTSTPSKGAANKAGCLYRIIRDGTVIAEGLPASSLKHFKDDVDEISRGKECGISLSGFNEYEKNDEIECYTVEMQHPKL